MTDSLAKTDEQYMQEFIAYNRITLSDTANRHIATVLAGAAVLHSFIDRLGDDRVISQLVTAATQQDSSYLKSVASRLRTEPSPDMLVDVAVNNLKKGNEHDLGRVIEETPSLQFLMRLSQAVEPPVVIHDQMPGDELLGAMDFLSYAAAFSEAT